MDACEDVAMKQTLIASVICQVAFVVATFGTEADKLSETRSTLERWVETKQLISKTRSDWQTDKETIEQTHAAHDWPSKIFPRGRALTRTHI